MDSTMTTVNRSINETNVKAANEEQCHQRSARSVSHGRPPSASGVRSKIPMNINQNRPTSSIANTQGTICTKDDTANPTITGITTRRLARSHNSTLSKSKNHGITQSGMQKRWLESQFRKEKKRYLSIKKELNEKQKCAQQMFNDMSQLREKLIADGIKDPGEIEEIKMYFNFSDKQSGDQNTYPSIGESGFADNSIINHKFVSIIENELMNCSKDCFTLCDDMMIKYSGAVKYMEDFYKLNEEFCKQMSEQVDNYKKDISILNERLENGKKYQNEFNIALVNKITMMWSNIETLQSQINNSGLVSDDMTNELRIKLNTEIEKFNQLKEKKATVDNELIKSNVTIQALEARVDTDQAKMAQLQTHIKNLEAQSNQKDINFEQSTRHLHKSLKDSEETIDNLESEKANLQLRLNEMKDKLKNESKRHLEMSPRVQHVTKHSVEHDILRDKDTKKRVGELETLVETLREEITCNKELIVKLQNEKSSNEIELKGQLTKEQVQAIKLKENYEQLKKDHDSMQQKCKTRNDQMLALYYSDYATKNSKNDSGSIESIQLIVDLRQEIAELERKNKDLMEQQQEQIKNLELKNEMITYLKREHTDGNNTNTHQVSKEIDLKSAEIERLQATLDTKQMQLNHLENVLKQMEGQEMRNQEQRTRYEKRIAQLEFDAHMKKTKDCRYVMDFSIPHSSSKQNEIMKAIELERKYQKLKKESYQMESFYNKLIESTVKSVRSRDIIQHSRSSCRGREHAYRSSSGPKRVNVGSYVHQVIEQPTRELDNDFHVNSKRKIRYGRNSPHRMRHKLLSTGESISHVHQ